MKPTTTCLIVDSLHAAELHSDGLWLAVTFQQVVHSRVFTAYALMILTAMTWAAMRDYLGNLDVFAWWDPIAKLIS